MCICFEVIKENPEQRSKCHFFSSCFSRLTDPVKFCVWSQINEKSTCNKILQDKFFIILDVSGGWECYYYKSCIAFSIDINLCKDVSLIFFFSFDLTEFIWKKFLNAKNIWPNESQVFMKIYYKCIRLLYQNNIHRYGFIQN